MDSNIRQSMLKHRAERLASAARREWRAFRRRQAPWITGIDVDGDTLRIAQVEKTQDGFKLKCVESIELRDPESGRIRPEVHERIKRLQVQRGRIVTFLPQNLVSVKRLTLPSSDLAELRRLAPFEAAKFLPHSPDELLVDVEIIRTSEDGQSDVRLVVARHDQVQDYLSLFDELDLEPSRIEISTAALARIMRSAQGNDENTGRQDAGLQSVCHVGNTRADLLIFSPEETIYSRGLDTRSLDGSIDALSEFILRSIRYGCHLEAGQKPPPLMLLMERDDGETLRRILNGRVALLPSRLPGIIEVQDRTMDWVPYAAAIGAALEPTEGLNLLPPALVERRRWRSRIHGILQTATLAIIFLFISTFLVDRYLAGAEQTLSRFRGELTELRPQVRDIRALQQRLEAVARHHSPQSAVLEIYTEIFRVAPDGLALNQLLMRRGRLIVKGG